MKTLVDQLSIKCIHFTGIMNECCAAGVKYSDVRVGKPYEFPCIGTGGECSKRKLRTPAEVEKHIKDLEDLAASQIAMYVLAKSHFAKTKERTAKIQCVCGGQMTYAVASNNHIRAKCPTCGQSFME